MPATLEPWLGSVMAIQCFNCPASSGFSQRCCCAGVPCRCSSCARMLSEFIITRSDSQQ
jgi:hypothetical protein